MDERVFDVSKPNKSDPGHTSKPIIVGHQPQMPDPMLREDIPDKPTVPEQPEFGPPAEGNPLGLPLSASEPATDKPSNPSLPPELTVANQAESLPLTENAPENSEIIATTEGADSSPPPVERKGDEPPIKPPVFNKATGQTVEPTPASWKPLHELPISGGGHQVIARKKISLIILTVILVAIGLFIFLDSGVAGKVNLPFSLFGSSEKTVPVSTTPSTNQPQSTPSAVYASYIVAGSDVSFSYPTVWGMPSVTSDPGFSKRGGENKTDGTYAFLVGFASNKEVQIAITSAQYLPEKRDPLFYDFQQWCTGTADGKIYRAVLNFTTSNGVDTPTTAVCDDGPLTGATKSSDELIIQLKTDEGDIYTQNLTSSDYPVIRVKDATGKNSKEIETLLASVNN